MLFSIKAAGKQSQVYFKVFIYLLKWGLVLCQNMALGFSVLCKHEGHLYKHPYCMK